jgi:type IV pilus assembly protein PilA
MKTKQSGFTLIELMIVVAIIGILSAIAVPAYQDYMMRAKVADGLTAASTIKHMVSEYYNERGRFPSSKQELGLTTTPITTQFVSDISVEAGGTGTIIILYKGSEFGSAVDQSIYLVPQVREDAKVIVWSCTDTRSTMPAKFRPAHCRPAAS